MRRPCAMLFLLTIGSAFAQPATLQVGADAYRYRSSSGALHEYTPDGQDDLDRFSDMVTLLPSPDGLGPQDLERFTADMADEARSRGGDVLSSSCEAANASHVADCTLFVMYDRDGHVEAAVAKHVALGTGIGALGFSHREYGPDARARVAAWIASPEGKQHVAGFIDWADRLALAARAR